MCLYYERKSEDQGLNLGIETRFVFKFLNNNDRVNFFYCARTGALKAAKIWYTDLLRVTNLRPKHL